MVRPRIKHANSVGVRGRTLRRPGKREICMVGSILRRQSTRRNREGKGGLWGWIRREIKNSMAFRKPDPVISEGLTS